MKLLICTSASDFCHGGVEKYLVDRLSRMDVSGFEITIVIPGRIIAQDWIDDLRQAVDCPLSFIELDVMKYDKARQVLYAYRRMSHLLDVDAFDLIHVNTGSLWLQAVCLHAARRAGVPRRIAHSHNSLLGVRRMASFSDSFFRPIINSCATQCFACSTVAGIWLFGEDEWNARGIVLKNGIDADHFAFDPTVRSRIREGVDTPLVVGVVGRLDEQKNQSFLLDVFARVVSICPESQLWIVGGGDDEGMLRGRVTSLGLTSQVKFLGSRADVAELLQGMDVFVLPSKFEGLGIALVEAQAAGLPCVASDAVPTDVDIHGCCIEHLSLDEPIEHWASHIINANGKRLSNGPQLVREAGYDVARNAHELEGLYRAI